MRRCTSSNDIYKTNNIEQKVINILSQAFQKKSAQDVKTVMESLLANDYDFKYINNANKLSFKLLPGDTVLLPERIHCSDQLKENTVLSSTQQLIYHCIFTRSTDGFIREKHIKAILDTDIMDWCMPFVLKICNEYIVEILYDVYDVLIQKDNVRLKEFCKLNLRQFLYSHARMISYWDYYYRNRWYNYHNYMGKNFFPNALVTQGI